MSLFGSIYEDAGAGDDAPPEVPQAPAIDVPDAPAPVLAPAGDLDAPIDVPDAPVDVPNAPIDVPDAPVIEAPAMSLQDFAAEVFGNRPDPATPSPPNEEPSAFAALGLDTGHGAAEDGSAPGLGAALEAADSPFAAAVASPAPTASVTTLPGAETLDAPTNPDEVLPPGNDGATLGTIPDLEPWDSYQDDLLPGRPARRGLSLPKGSGSGSRRPLKTLALVALAVLAGLYGVRTLKGGGGGDAVPERQAAGNDKNVVVGPVTSPGNLGNAIGSAEIAAAEVELRTAAALASAEFAESGSFVQPPEAWQEVLAPSKVAAATGNPQKGVLHVTADDDAVCFETLTGSGATVAVGVTANGFGFASSDAGASVCSTDAAVIAGWVPSLIVSAG